MTKKQDLIDGVTTDITSGRLKAGDLIPTTTQLMEQYGAAKSTVRSAVDVLRHAGLVVFEPGIGVKVADRPAP
jgi:DNA-binding FadR family transcriptional regulator